MYVKRNEESGNCLKISELMANFIYLLLCIVVVTIGITIAINGTRQSSVNRTHVSFLWASQMGAKYDAYSRDLNLNLLSLLEVSFQRTETILVDRVFWQRCLAAVCMPIMRHQKQMHPTYIRYVTSEPASQTPRVPSVASLPSLSPTSYSSSLVCSPRSPCQSPDQGSKSCLAVVLESPCRSVSRVTVTSVPVGI